MAPKATAPLPCDYGSHRAGVLQDTPRFRSFSASAIIPKDLNAPPCRAGASIFRGGRPIVCNVRTTITTETDAVPGDLDRGSATTTAGGGSRSRGDERGRSYWSTTRRPLPCLVFVAPILLAYELGVLWLGGDSADALRTGADAWMRHGLVALVADRPVVPALEPGPGPRRLAGGRPARLAVPPGDAAGHGDRERRPGRRAGRAEQGGRPRVHAPGTGRAAEPGHHRPGRRPPGGPLDRLPGRGGL